MQEIYERVAKWNKLRYEREYNEALTFSLLQEELKEFYDAKNVVEEVDALCDVMFIAFGGIWKLGEDIDACMAHAVKVAQGLINVQELMPAYYIPAFMGASAITDYPQMTMLCVTIQLAASQLTGYGLDRKGVEEVLLAVCDSNDTKCAEKIPTDSKYTNQGKGDDYISPKLAITNILRSKKCLSTVH